MRLTMIFVDGFGLGAEEDNPLVLASTPNIDRLLGGHFLWGEREMKSESCSLYSLDATLGVEGIPQSATGQTTLWTGINTAKVLGYHLNAYPNDKLKQVITKHSIFKQLTEKGKRVTFANAFSKSYDEQLESGKIRHAASTLCALAGGVKLRRKKDLLEGKAVYQDITNQIFRNRGEDVPLIQPFFAGENLARMSIDYEFTLFEYFQTDIRGHKGQAEEAIITIETLDEFLGGYLSVAESLDSSENKMGLLLTSDHGNIEDLSVSTHTRNKVPAICWSNFGMKWPKLKSIQEITPTIVEVLH